MKKNILFLLSIFFSFLLMSCVTTGFNDFYNPWYEDNFFPETAYLKEGEIPEVIKTSDLDSKFREISSQWYWCIGSSGFNGAELSDLEIQQALTNLCTEKKAKIAIYSKEYTDTRSGVTSTPYTNYHYYTDANGYMHSYTTTSYSTRSYSIDRYDFSSYLFISIPEDYKVIYIPGIATRELTQKDRDLYKQNTGIIINTVYQNSSAFFANLSYGDIITNINGTPIYSYDDFDKVKKMSNYGDVWNMTIVRFGQEKQVSLTYK